MADSFGIFTTNVALASGVATAIFGGALSYVLYKKSNKLEDDRSRLAPSVAASEASIDTSSGDDFDPLVYPGGLINIYFGSQTGTAEDFCGVLGRDAAHNGFKARIINLEDVSVDGGGNGDYPAELLQGASEERAACSIFLMATYGEGDPTDNVEDFIQVLKERSGKTEGGEVDPVYLKGLDYAVFGLGNVLYENYNAIGKLTDYALERLGANRIIDLCLGNDDDDLEGDFDTWREEKLWPAVVERYIGKNNATTQNSTKMQITTTKLPPCEYAIEFLDDLAAKRAASSKDRGSTLHIELNIAGSLTYETADNLGILPVNDISTIRRVAQRLGYDVDAIVRTGPGEAVKKKESFRHPFPTPCTVGEILGRYCDLTGPLRRSDLKILSNYTTDELDKTSLVRMSSKEGKNEFQSKVVDGMLGLVDILEKCPSIDMPLEYFLSVCPRLQPRYYTISSSSLVNPNSVHLTIAITKCRRSDGSILGGTCTSHIASRAVDPALNSLRVFLKESSFRLPKDCTKPIIMIGPGTGIAPMRALLQERSHQRLVLKKKVGKSTLYFGCKNRRIDFIYQNELDIFQKEGTLNSLHLAFSRDQKQKVYVQDLLSKNASETWNILDRLGGHVYVCGGVAMGKDVVRAFIDIVACEGQRTNDEAKTYISQMQQAGRFVQELWA
eukprot:CAMPEP_0113305172 /NCGR_PEP_ID=MMETSP0010_2-20120614/4892_1 /TAXON_ID=216773 ORGANISM="Corethron hystrix, Strain 308" /NCGR_SAMPLE_ID=MMETSP0010_2 /ASSEMBLY_ACC=CAM_ASM_000155 /LENGTH=669 /DNA_ID=CAMNT_0000159511 /DNA_START=118 /DNA_END=2128 /DNA_ORIENTATION=- /assembly_acc=CAM_ASM_000155